MSAARAKGTRFESDVVNYLIAHGFPHAERRALTGARDKGDITGIPGVVLECKNEKAIRLGEYMTETEKEATNARARIWAAVVKRRQRNAADAFVVMPLRVFVDLLRDDPPGGEGVQAA